jgi:hypothetical protein
MHMEFSQLINQIKLNKKYRNISDDIIKKEIESYLNSSQLKPEEISKKELKEIRARLHRLYSSYQVKKKKKAERYIEELENSGQVMEITYKLLNSTRSTKERILDYPLIYKKIFEITGKPGAITDLGAGLNIFSYPLMKLKKLIYYSYDIDEKDLELINKYIKTMKRRGLTGKAEILDIRDLRKLQNIPRSDIIFLFKIIDLIEEKFSKPGEEIIKYLLKEKTNFTIASFATKTLSGKPMNLPRRKGFELMLKRNNLNFKFFKTGNEIFYIIRSFRSKI